MDTIIALQYLFVFNVLTFALFAWDKHLAFYEKRRKPEWLLLFMAAIGGAFGALNAMMLFRHKTKHIQFVIGMPAILILHIVVAVLCVIYL